jgi:hypothetical protein
MVSLGESRRQTQIYGISTVLSSFFIESDSNIKHYSNRWFILFQIKQHDFEIIMSICH